MKFSTLHRRKWEVWLWSSFKFGVLFFLWCWHKYSWTYKQWVDNTNFSINYKSFCHFPLSRPTYLKEYLIRIPSILHITSKKYSNSTTQTNQPKWVICRHERGREWHCGLTEMAAIFRSTFLSRYQQSSFLSETLSQLMRFCTFVF